MRSDRVSYDFGNWTNSNVSSRVTNNQTPKNKQKIPGYTQVNRKSISPLRINNDRISSSPLKGPLQNAISRCIKQKSLDKSTSRRTMGKSSRRQEASFIDVIKKINYQEDASMKNVKAHSQTMHFIKKHFDINYVIPTDQFINKILYEFSALWQNKNIQRILQDFSYKVNDMFGVDGIDPRDLIRKTKDQGMLGLIMNILKQISEEQSSRNENYMSFSRNPQVISINKSFQQRLNYNQSLQNIKNVVQQFMESMYQCMQSQIYNKFNIQMRRMVLKYRETEKMIKNINQKITSHADFFQLQNRLKKKQKKYEQAIGQLQKKCQKLESQFAKQREISMSLKNSKYKLEDQIIKLKENAQKFQNLLINKAFESTANTDTITGLSRRSSALTDKTQQFYSNANVQPQPEPFQIKIDTHIFQRDLGPPNSQTTTTFLNQSPIMNGYSPLKKQEQIPRFNNDVGRYSYSPYSSRLGRPF